MRRLILPSLILGCLAGLFAACYGRAIFQGEQFAYRDAGRYYYPLHQRVQAEWEAGRWPLWEPEENSGMPLLGNPTAAVLYPGKLVFSLVRYPLAARLYVMGHTLLAFAAMMALLRHWGASWVGSALGALAYAFGGPVLFQHCNIIYLVGAAWLPLGFRAVDRWLRLGYRIALAELAVVLAMETLGGDPESAYLTGLCAASYAAGLAWQNPRRTKIGGDAASEGSSPQVRRSKPHLALLAVVLLLTLWGVATLAVAQWAPLFLPVKPARPPLPPRLWTAWIGPTVAAAWALAGLTLVARWRRLRRSGARPILVPLLFGLVVSAVVAAATAAAQLLPVVEFTSQSGRAAEDSSHDIYPFSLFPIRVVEFVWPNVFGTFFHGNTLWLGAFPPKDSDVKLWVPTLYLGTFTLVLALGGARLRFAEGDPAPWRTWMAAVTGVSLLGSFGEYGSPIWLARMASIFSESESHSLLHNGDGGVYWLLATALPGFGQFRYPSKLLTFTVLGLASMAALGWDLLVSDDPRAKRRIAGWSGFLLVLTLVVLGLSAARRDDFLAWLGAQKLDSVFGPFDAPGALAETQGGLIQAALVLAVALLLTLRIAHRRPTIAAGLVLVVTTVDLGFANARMVATVPQSAIDSPPAALTAIERAENEKPASGPYRVHRVPIWGPVEWGETASSDRLREFVDWERETAAPKYGIPFGIHYTLALGVAQSFDYERFFGGFHYGARDRAARFLGVNPGTKLVVYPRRAFNLWNTRYFILPYSTQWDHEYRGIASFLEHTERIVPPPDAFQGADGQEKERAWARNHDYQVRRNFDEYPRSWIVHEARWLPPSNGSSNLSRDLSMEEILFSNDLSWPDPTLIVYDARRYTWLEVSDRPGLAAYLSGDAPTAGESVRVVSHEPDRVELEAVLDRPGIVVLSDVYYPGWTLTIDGQPAQVYRVNRMMRGAAVTQGRHTLVYKFRPASFRIGLVVSGLGLTALVALVIWSALPRSGKPVDFLP